MRQLNIADALNFCYPQPLAFLTTTTPDGKRNVMALGWLMQASFEPPILGAAVSVKNYTHHLIEQCEAFAVSLAGEGQADLINKVGTLSSTGSDKLAELGISATPGPVTGSPLIDGAAVHFECHLYRRVTVGDHSVFFGKIAAAYVPEAPVQKIDNFGAQRYAPAAPAL